MKICHLTSLLPWTLAVNVIHDELYGIEEKAKKKVSKTINNDE